MCVKRECNVPFCLKILRVKNFEVGTYEELKFQG